MGKLSLSHDTPLSPRPRHRPHPSRHDGIAWEQQCHDGPRAGPPPRHATTNDNKTGKTFKAQRARTGTITVPIILVAESCHDYASLPNMCTETEPWLQGIAATSARVVPRPRNRTTTAPPHGREQPRTRSWPRADVIREGYRPPLAGLLLPLSLLACVERPMPVLRLGSGMVGRRC